MAKDWYLMNKLPVYNGGYEGEEWAHYAQQGFQEMLDTTMLCDHVEYINSDFTKIVKGQAVIQSVTQDTADNQVNRQILAPIGTLSKYSYVRFKDVVWLIAAEPSDNKFYEKAPLKLCNNKLRWQNAETKEIFEYWYYSEDSTRYSSGVYEGNVIIQYDKQYNIELPYDRHTQKLHDGMRFMLEMSDNIPMVFKLTKFDGVTGNNKNVKLLKLTLTQTVYDPIRDNVDNMIADYFPYKEEENDSGFNCRILYEKDEIKIASSADFTALLLDSHDKPVEQEIHWSISDNDFDDDCIQLSADRMKVTVSVKKDTELIGKRFRLNATLQDDETILSSVEILIIPLW